MYFSSENYFYRSPMVEHLPSKLSFATLIWIDGFELGMGDA